MTGTFLDRSGMTDLTPIEPRRIVTCQYSAEPHPIDDECSNVTDLTPVDRTPATRDTGQQRTR